MSKNLTRKGLAFGAVVALGTTLFAGAPAQAASVLFAPTTGTGNTLVAGETFSLTASLSSDLPAANSTQLKFKVANTTGVAATVTINGSTIIAAQAAGTAHAAGFAPVALDASVGGTTAGSALTAGTSSAVFGVSATAVAADSAAVAGAASSATNPTTIAIASTAATTASYTVTAFLDANNNAVIDGGELSAVQTVNFVKVADSGVTVAFTKPSQNSTALAATVTFAADVNVAQLTAGKYKVGYGLSGVSGVATAIAASGTVAANLTAVAKNTGNTALVSAAQAAHAAPTAGATYNAQAFYDNASTTYAAIGTAAVQVVSASTDADAMPLVVAPTVSDNIAVTTASSATFPTTAVNGVYKVRTAVTSTSVSATIKKTPTGVTASGTSGVAVGAGVAVDVYVTAANGATPAGSTTADTLTVAGVNVITSGATANVSASVKIATVTTDSTGKVSVPVLSSLGTAADSVTIVLKVPNAASTASGQVQLVWTAATVVAPQYIYSGNATPTVVKGGAVSLKYALTDSYGALVTSSSYQLLFTSPGINGTSVNATPVNVYAPFVDGIATVSFTDNSLAAGTNAATYKVLKNVNGAWVEPANAAPDAAIYTANGSPIAASINVIAAAQTAAAVSASAVNSDGTTANASTATAALDVATGAYASGDPRSNANGFVVPAPTADSVVAISGTVTDASGVGVAGAQVTLSLKGAQFASAAFANANAVYATDSITVNTSTTGGYTVYVATHTAGKNSVVVTSGAATKTLSVYVAAAHVATGKTLTITAPATAQSGTSVSYSVVLTDKYGNPVAVAATGVTPTFSFSATGVGSSTAEVKSTTAAGYAAGSTTTQVLDAGNLVITATYNFDGATASAPVTATATIVVSDLAKAAAGAATASVATVTVTAATTSQAGRAIDVTVKAVDAAGAAVAGAVVALSSTGAGSLSASSVVTNASGVAVVKLVAGASDLGSAVVTATSNGKSSAPATVEFGATDATVDIIGKRVYVTTEFAAGKRVTIYDNGVRRYSAIQTADAEKVVMWNVKSGSHTIVVKISGASSDAVTFLVK